LDALLAARARLQEKIYASYHDGTRQKLERRAVIFDREIWKLRLELLNLQSSGGGW